MQYLTLCFIIIIFIAAAKKLKPKTRYKNAITNLALSCCKKLLKEIYDFKPDIVYGTHFYVGAVLSLLKLAYNLPCKTIVSTLDYTNTPFWESSVGIDYLTLPNQEFIAEFVEEGFKEEQLIVTGLPCGDQFMLKEDKLEARKELGLDVDKFTIMVMFGGGYWSGGYKILKKLIKCVKGKDVQIIMINGKNQQDFVKVEKLKNKLKDLKLINVGFTNQIAKYMSATDVIINKMGGLSLTETLNKQVPCIAYSRLPGQELANLKYVQEKGLAKAFKNKKELGQAINSFIDDRKELDRIKVKMLEYKSDGLNKIVNLIKAQPEANYDEKYISTISFNDVEKNIRKIIKTKHKEEKKK